MLEITRQRYCFYHYASDSPPCYFRGNCGRQPQNIILTTIGNKFPSSAAFTIHLCRNMKIFLNCWQKNSNKQSNIQPLDHLLKAVEETGGFEAIHLGMMKLERDGQGRFEQPLMVFAPSQEGIGE